MSRSGQAQGVLSWILSLPSPVLRLLSGGGATYREGRTLDPRLQFLAAGARRGRPMSAMTPEEARDWVRSAVEDLPEPLRAALVLVYHQGMKYREAADVLGIPVGTVKSRLHSALLKLNESWQRSGRSAAGADHG